ncbi:MAG: 2-C-methyl-D-erythritol 2,4-cyclodiphosphate synthase [Oscillospiraceae bacterium]|nr:2-C-methyl-D-erythritol 2,4-cyclodiphosphate synthase [Oscillospiraceae bacterium]
MANFRIGHGYDVHRLTENRKLIIGGTEIPHRLGLLGHSDADVLTHAVMDAMLGALALGDIGQHFPDTDPKYAGADSIRLMRHVNALIQKQGWQIGNLDATILAQAPKLAPYIPQMRKKYAEVLGCDLNQISIKATTEEKLGFTGQEQGIAAHCVVLLERIPAPFARKPVGKIIPL